MPLAVVDALEPCAVEMRTLFAVAKVVEGVPTIAQLVNWIRKAFSLSGTVKWMTHFQPFSYVPSATAEESMVSIELTASGVELPVDRVTKVMLDEVVVPTLLPEDTLKL